MSIEAGKQALVSVVQLKDHNIALLFSNYMKTLGIDLEVEQSTETGYIIYCREEDLALVKTEFEAFILNPYANKYQLAAWQHGETVRLNAGDYTLLKSFKENFLAHAGWVTLSIFIVCWLVFLASELGWAKTLFTSLHFYPQLSIDAFIAEPLRLIGPAFFHFSWLHIVFNTMWWWQLGGSIEKQLGKTCLLNVLLISAIVSNLGQYMVTGANFGGLSGVVYALVGFVWWCGFLAPEQGLSLAKPIVAFLLFWLVLGFVDLLPVNLANTAHLLGLISGCLLALFTVKVIGVEKPRR
jgi:GlpG protein